MCSSTNHFLYETLKITHVCCKRLQPNVSSLCASQWKLRQKNSYIATAFESKEAAKWSGSRARGPERDLLSISNQ